MTSQQEEAELANLDSMFPAACIFLEDLRCPSFSATQETWSKAEKDWTDKREDVAALPIFNGNRFTLLGSEKSYVSEGEL